MVPKYPRTYHLPFSLEIHSDDKQLDDLSSFINRDIIITEKLDGGNCCIHRGNVYARSTNSVTTCSSFDYVKKEESWKTLGFENLYFYGENVYAKHTIFYERLTHFFYLFAIREIKENVDRWMGINELIFYSRSLNMPLVPTLFKGRFKDPIEIESWMLTEISKPSEFGDLREGFVIRIQDEFSANLYNNSVAKFVRKNHVQTDEHWSKKWTPNKMRG